MKKFITLLFLLFILLLNVDGNANEVTVKGYVKGANGSPVPGVIVKILVETPCVIEYRVTTNNDGYYQEKVKCNEAIKKVRLSIVCGSQIVTVLKEVPASNMVEANLIMCVEALSCMAKFNFERLPSSAAQKFPTRFNSNSSEAKAGDVITERKWKFGDGETASGADLIHNYAKPGVYEVCLTIMTASGCTSTKCMAVEVKEGCIAKFEFGLSPAGVRFNSNLSVGAPGDPVKNRTWNFGDGSPLVKGPVDPLHVFPRPGTYTVCLVIVTNSGCESKECKQVIVPAGTAPGCISHFSFEQLAPNKYRFNSSQSKTSGDDAIIAREWEFRDGSPILKNNEASVVHEFGKPGLYEVCLKIKTARGCESRICLPVKVDERAAATGPSVNIITLYPTPFHHELKAVIHSKQANVKGTISIVDVYGQVKMTKQVVLVQGNNPFEIETTALLTGPYFFKLTTAYGTQSRPVYKQ